MDYNADNVQQRYDDQENECDTAREGPPTRKLFVGNLLPRTTKRELRKFFSSFGKVKDCCVAPQKKWRAKYCYGFVTFKFPEDAYKVLQADRSKFQLSGHRFVVAPAYTWHQPLELPNGKIIWKRHMQNWANTDGNCEHVSVPLQPNVNQDIDESKCKVHILNDDCLVHVFSFLSLRERIKIERVCKRWRSVVLNMWLCEQDLDVAAFFHPLAGDVLTPHILCSLLQRCGHNLTRFNLCYKPHSLNQDALLHVGKYAPKLQYLNVSSLSVGGNVLALSRISHQIRQLTFDDCSFASEQNLSSLFRNCSRLESLVLSHNNAITGKCLTELHNSNLTELVLNDCNNLHTRFLVHALKGMEKLESLSCDSCLNLSSCDIDIIIKCVPQLKCLSLGNSFPLFSGFALHSVCTLYDLVSLNLHLNSAVNDQVLDAISVSCMKLQRLNISGCGVPLSRGDSTLTDSGIKMLARLPSLTHLFVSYLAMVTDEVLDDIANRGLLKMLECRGCPTFTDNGCMRVLAQCTELELFDVSSCDNVTDVTINSAIEAVKLRPNNVKLTFIAGGTKITDDPSREIAPLLEVKFTDLCVARFRPDFEDDTYLPSSDFDDYDDDYDDDDDDYDGESDDFYNSTWESELSSDAEPYIFLNM